MFSRWVSPCRRYVSITPLGPGQPLPALTVMPIVLLRSWLSPVATGQVCMCHGVQVP